MRRAARIVLAGALAGAVAVTGVAAAKTEFFVRGAKLTKQADGSWSGSGKLAGAGGQVTVTGKVELLKTRKHTIKWSWKSGKRLVSGCSVNQVLTRPHGIQLWDGSGRVKQTGNSKSDRKYRGLYINLYGPTKRSDLDHAKLSIHSFTPSRKFPAVRC
jgi:hypothetical protein